MSDTVCIDLETLNDERKLGLSYYHPDFKVVSASFLVGDSCGFSQDPEEIAQNIKYFYENDYTILVYNVQFEGAIFRHVYGLEKAFDRCIDVWKLFNYCCLIAPDKFSKVKRKTSLNAAVEYLFGVDNYKLPYLNYFLESGKAKTEKEAHAMIADLPPDLLEEYNNADVLWCRRVYDECIKRLTEWDMDWKFDYEAYSNEARVYSDAYVKGIKVDRELMAKNITELLVKIAEVEGQIRELPQVKEVEADYNKKYVEPVLTTASINRWKKKKGLGKDYQLSEEESGQVLAQLIESKYVKFNLNSTHHKQRLFLDKLGMATLRLTPAGAPKMSKAILKEYGDVGKLFVKYQNLSKQLEECEKIYKMSEFDGRLRLVMRSGSVVTGRSSSKT